MEEKRFQKKKEDFSCEHCGTEVVGSGYTNHCPKCLWSKHVDVNPGDRAETCGGLMEPVRVEKDKDAFKIVQICTVCKMERRCKMSMDDDFEAIAAVARKAQHHFPD